MPVVLSFSNLLFDNSEVSCRQQHKLAISVLINSVGVSRSCVVGSNRQYSLQLTGDEILITGTFVISNIDKGEPGARRNLENRTDFKTIFLYCNILHSFIYHRKIICDHCTCNKTIDSEYHFFLNRASSRRI